MAKIRVRFGETEFAYKGDTEFSKDDLIDLLTALYQGNPWDAEWDEYDYEEDEEESDEDSDDDSDEDDESDDESEDDDESDDYYEEDEDGDSDDDEDEPEAEEDDEEAEEDSESDVAEPVETAVDAPEVVDEYEIIVLADDSSVDDELVGLIETIEAGTAREFVLAAAAKLNLIDDVTSFSRDDIRGLLKLSGEYYNENHVKSLSRSLQQLKEDGMLIENRNGTYRLSAAGKRHVEATFPQGGA